MPKRRLAIFLSLGALAACSDYALQPSPGDPDWRTSDSALLRDSGLSQELDPPLVSREPCNGLDDDGDGLTDEGWPDSDQDGEADCVDQDLCEIAAEDPQPVQSDGSCCLDEVSQAEIDVAVEEWSWTGVSGDTAWGNISHTPAVGPLLDSDGDGDVDQDDVPCVAFIAWEDINSNQGMLVVLDGSSGEEILALDDYHSWFGAAIADVDGDGWPEVLGVTDDSHVKAVQGDGSRQWTSDDTVGSQHAQPLVADLDGDGAAEVVMDDLVLEGATGETRIDFGLGGQPAYRTAAVGDLDQDGQQEIVLAGRVLELDGSTRWVANGATSAGSVYPALLQADSDPQGEVLFLSDDRYTLYDDDGSQLADRALSIGSTPSPPCVADFDGDGAPEVAWTQGSHLRVSEPDGSELWSIRIQDNSTRSACIGFDFEGDGTYELLYGDEQAFYVVDGPTGALLATWDEHQSVTIIETPVVADIDADGSAEILVASNSSFTGQEGWSGLTALGHPEQGWPRSGTSWHAYDFAVTNILADGSVPAMPVPPWLAAGVYRARPAGGEPAANLRVQFTDACMTGCVDSSVLQLAVSLSNQGARAVEEPIEVALYRVDDGVESLLQVQRIEPPLEAGMSGPGLIFELQRGDVGGQGLLIRADDDGGGAGELDECLEEDNEDSWDALPC